MVATAGARGRGLEARVRILLRRGASVYLQDANDGTALVSTPPRKQARFAVVSYVALTSLGLAVADHGVGLRMHTNTATAATGLPNRMLVAAGKGAAHDVTAWLDEGGGVDAGCAEREGETLLMSAGWGGQKVMVRLLLRRGASVNLQRYNGGTALMDAAYNDHATTVQALLDAKADTSLQSTNGWTALTLAEHWKNSETAQVLRQHAKQQAAEAKAVEMHAAANLSGRGVRIFDLKGRPELNGRCGVAGRFDAAKGRYEVAVEGEAEAVLLKPANLQEA